MYVKECICIKKSYFKDTRGIILFLFKKRKNGKIMMSDVFALNATAKTKSQLNCTVRV